MTLPKDNRMVKIQGIGQKLPDGTWDKGGQILPKVNSMAKKGAPGIRRENSKGIEAKV